MSYHGTNPVKAIKQHCIECFGGSPSEVAGCTSPQCPLYDFRTGRNTRLNKRTVTEATKAKLQESLKKARQLKNG